MQTNLHKQTSYCCCLLNTMDSSVVEAVIFSCILQVIKEKRKKQRKIHRRRYWIHPLWRNRVCAGYFVTQFPRLIKSPDKFFDYYGMTFSHFKELVNILRPNIQKKNTTFRRCISAEERLCVMLKYLFYGCSFKYIAYDHQIGRSTARKIVLETCEALWKTLMPIVLPAPSGEHWQRIEEEFSKKWNFPNCIGAIDGKHIVCQAPSNSGSMFFNYKKTFSVVLLAVVDAENNFLIVDIGSYGKNSDGGILSNSSFGKKLQNNELEIPAAKPLHGTTDLPHVFVGDEAFPLQHNLMRPYPREQMRGNTDIKIYNYRHSRARRIVECTFGILVQRFEIYSKRIRLAPPYLNDVVMATICLHNYLNRLGLPPPKRTPEAQKRSKSRRALQPLPSFLETEEVIDAVRIRESFKRYFNSEEGSLNWQYERVNRT